MSNSQVFDNSTETDKTVTINADAVVIGAGVLGLLLAKRLVDFGQKVVLVEQNETVAYGASIKNHGWLHTGTVHALSVQDTKVIKKMIKKIQYGYNFFTQYAPECIEDPFTPTYVITNNDATAAKARQRWEEFGVPIKELSKPEFDSIEPGLDAKFANAFFESNDARLNIRLLYKKLITEIERKGATIITSAQYEYEDKNTITITANSKITKVNSPLFFYATGKGLAKSYEKLTKEKLDMQCWKSHLLLMPRFTEASIVSIDRDAPIIINHGDISIVNCSYDEVACDEEDTSIYDEKVKMAIDILCTYYPKAKDVIKHVKAIACIKPSIAETQVGRHSVDEKIYSPMPGHFFALPGKMTVAPYVADTMIKNAYAKLDITNVSKRPMDSFLVNLGLLSVSTFKFIEPIVSNINSGMVA